MVAAKPDPLPWPKWPALLVVGQPVTKLQAAEILVRTHSHYLDCNDYEWTCLCRKIMGFPVRKERFGSTPPEFWKQEEDARKALGMLDLNYLDTNRIMSSWVGGPKGWVDWNGAVFTNNYNVGKWPGPGGIRQDWQTIARAFPFLDLTCQLMSGETCEEGTVPIAEYRILKGKVTSKKKPGKVIAGGPSDSGIALNPLRGGSLIQERGCTEEQLRMAVKHVREIMGRAA